jgi:hypothetical protein
VPVFQARAEGKDLTRNLRISNWTRFSFLFLVDSGGDQNEHNALALLSGDTARFEGCYLSSAHQGDNVVIGSNFIGDVTLSGCRIFGARYNGVKLLKGPKAIVLTGNVIGNNNTANDPDAHGVWIEDEAGYFTITGNHIGQVPTTAGNNMRYGVRVGNGASDHYVIANNVCWGNVSGAVYDGGTGSNKSVTGNVC